MKVCSKCKQEKELDEYSNSKDTLDGKQRQCRECQKDYYKENREKLLNKQKQYQKENSEKVKKTKKKYREKNKDKARQYYLDNKEYLDKQNREYRKKNKERMTNWEREYKKEYRKKNKDKMKKYRDEYRFKNKDKLTHQKKEYDKKYIQTPRGKVISRAKNAKRRAMQKQRTPIWVDSNHLEKIKEYYRIAQIMMLLFPKELYEVDHIVPLQGKEVSGLHVWWNLQVITKSENCKKSYKLIKELL